MDRGAPKPGGGAPKLGGGAPKLGGGAPKLGGGAPKLGGGAPKLGGGAPKLGLLILKQIVAISWFKKEEKIVAIYLYRHTELRRAAAHQ